MISTQRQQTGSDRMPLSDDSDSESAPTPASDSDVEFEAHAYYYGLPSTPVVVYRTGRRWKKPTGREAYLIPKEVRPVFDHPIEDAWDRLGQLVLDYLDSVSVKWTTIDVARFAEVEREFGPPVLWIGVVPKSLSREDAKAATAGCKRLLNDSELTDVEVAFRESLFTRSAGPRLLKRVSSYHATAGVRGPLTPALGLQIAARATAHVEGTGALYMRESKDSGRVFLLTARHVVLPPNAEPNGLYVHDDASQTRRDVLHLGSKAFDKVLASITDKIRGNSFTVQHYNDTLEALATRVASDDKIVAEKARKKRTKIEDQLQEAKTVIDTLEKFQSDVKKLWSAESQRVIGHIAYSPPISVGTGTTGFIGDWALIELDCEKIDWKTFGGNVIDLGMLLPISPRSFGITFGTCRHQNFAQPVLLQNVSRPSGRLLLQLPA